MSEHHTVQLIGVLTGRNARRYTVEVVNITSEGTGKGYSAGIFDEGYNDVTEQFDFYVGERTIELVHEEFEEQFGHWYTRA